MGTPHMRIEDINIGELVEFDSEDGVVRFAGQRALIIDATAKGNLRKELINTAHRYALPLRHHRNRRLFAF